MHAAERRTEIMARLRNTSAPLSATTLARQFSVSRQIVVGDIALLRAGGEEIDATPRGYLLRRPAAGERCTIACHHSPEDMGRELYLCVDNGCTVLDVIVEHPLYGQLVGQLQLASRYDVGQFLEQAGRAKASPLSLLTDGLHLHTLLCPDRESYLRVCRALREAGILLEGQGED